MAHRPRTRNSPRHTERRAHDYEGVLLALSQQDARNRAFHRMAVDSVTVEYRGTGGAVPRLAFSTSRGRLRKRAK